MGIVFAASHTLLGQRVALKLIRPEFLGHAEAVARFLHEARAAARIENEHVARVLDFGTLNGELPYIVFEFLDGMDLGELLLEHGPLPVTQTVDYLLQAIDAVAHAHALGIVHRDLKPANLFLARRPGGTEHLKVLDFGISKSTNPDDTDDTGITKTSSQMLGSPRYMSPEQLIDSRTVDHRCDIWALGVVAYELLTGRPPFLGNNVVALYAAIQTAEPLRIRALRTDVEIDPELEAAIMKCLRNHADDRFSSVTELGAMLVDFASPVGAHAFESAKRVIPLQGMVPSSERQWDRINEIPTIPPPRSQRSAADTDPMQTTRTDLATTRAILRKMAYSQPAVEEVRAVAPAPSRRSGLAAGVIALFLLLGAGALGIKAIHSRETPTPPGFGMTPVTTPQEVRCPADMEPIPAGVFTMGSEDGKPDERPVRRISIDPFCIDLTEVTTRAYSTCAAAKVCPAPGTMVDWPRITNQDHRRWSGFCNGGRTDRSEHPINCVTWTEADLFCKWAGKRLPTEEEWEYAARGKDGFIFPWGNDSPTAQHLNACGPECMLGRGSFLAPASQPLYPSSDGWESTAPVRSFGAGKTATGVYDLAGNVWEWTASRYCPYTDPDCTVESRITRGGAWNSDLREDVRMTRRDKNTPAARTADVGFRCAL